MNQGTHKLYIKLKPSPSIRDFYHPLQPTVKPGNTSVVYQEFLPPPTLQSFIYCYWQLQTHLPLETPYLYRVVSDGCIDIFFNLNAPAENFVMGFWRKYTEFAIGTEFNFMGIRFFPSAFPQLLGISAKTLSNTYQELSHVVPAAADFISQKMTQETSVSIQRLNDFFTQFLPPQPIDDRFYQALILLLKHHGHIETEQELDTGLSPRQLRRIFNYYIGTTPKTFSQVVRFQYILNAKPSRQSLKENKIFYDVGFYDQAHFIKAFTQFYGVTPARAFR